MPSIITEVTEYLLDQFQSSGGINATLKHLRAEDKTIPADVKHFSGQNVSPELLERSNSAVYPSMFVYCEKINNTLMEKFRSLSGTVRMVIEIRNSSDRLEAMESTQIYANLICNGLESLRGEWIRGVFYNGEFDATYSPVRSGGRNFLQSAKITFEVEISQ